MLGSSNLLPDMSDSVFSPWDQPPRHKFSLDNTEFPALGQKSREPGIFSSLSSRPPNSPSQAPSRPQSLSDHQFLLDGPFASGVPGLGLPGSGSSRGYLGSLSNKNGEPTGDFQIQPEDFPALGNPVGNVASKLTNSTEDDSGNRDFADSSVLSGFDTRVPGSHLISGLSDPLKDPKGDDRRSFHMPEYRQSRPAEGAVGSVQYDANSNKLKSVPASMLTDKYSFLGCLKVLKEVIGDKRYKDQIAQVHDLDKDLTKMGLSFIKDNRLIYRFQSPFAEMPCRVQDIDMFVPNEYLTNLHIREKLAEIKTSKYNEDLLFWMFYSNPNDRMQCLAAEALFERNWKFHKDEKIWISRTRNIEARVKNNTYEEGTFMVWDVESWKKVPRDMKVEYSKLAPDNSYPHVQRPVHTPQYNDPSALGRGSL